MLLYTPYTCKSSVLHIARSLAWPRKPTNIDAQRILAIMDWAVGAHIHTFSIFDGPGDEALTREVLTHFLVCFCRTAGLWAHLKLVWKKKHLENSANGKLSITMHRAIRPRGLQYHNPGNISQSPRKPSGWIVQHNWIFHILLLKQMGILTSQLSIYLVIYVYWIIWNIYTYIYRYIYICAMQGWPCISIISQDELKEKLTFLSFVSAQARCWQALLIMEGVILPLTTT
jgi:hypothetical protein